MAASSQSTNKYKACLHAAIEDPRLQVHGFDINAVLSACAGASGASGASGLQEAAAGPGPYVPVFPPGPAREIITLYNFDFPGTVTFSVDGATYYAAKGEIVYLPKAPTGDVSVNVPGVGTLSVKPITTTHMSTRDTGNGAFLQSERIIGTWTKYAVVTSPPTGAPGVPPVPPPVTGNSPGTYPPAPTPLGGSPSTYPVFPVAGNSPSAWGPPLLPSYAHSRYENSRPYAQGAGIADELSSPFITGPAITGMQGTDDANMATQAGSQMFDQWGRGMAVNVYSTPTLNGAGNQFSQYYNGAGF